jgi:hypothetical protein
VEEKAVATEKVPAVVRAVVPVEEKAVATEKVPAVVRAMDSRSTSQAVA